MLIVIVLAILMQIVVKAEDYVHSPIQYHSQTDSGTYNFGYDTGLFGSHQFHQEHKDAGGQVRGRYGYTDPYGKLRLVHYTSGPQGYEVVSDTELDKTKDRKTPDPVITNVIERYKAVPKSISKPVYSKPAPLQTPAKLVISTPSIAISNYGNERVRSYLAGRDYGEVIVESPPLQPVHYAQPLQPVHYAQPLPPPTTVLSPVSPALRPPRTISVLSPVQRLRAAALTGRSIDGGRVHRSVTPDRYKPEFNPPEGYTSCTCV